MVEAAMFMVGSVAALIVCVINGINKKNSRNPLIPAASDVSSARILGPEEGRIEELQQEVARYEEHMEKLRAFGRNRTEVEHEIIDAILLGPRSSGKTSLAELWANPVSYNVTQEATMAWRRVNLSLHEFGIEKKHDPLFDVVRGFKKVLRLRLHDYPGELSKVPEAFQKINDLSSKATIIFMLQVGYSDGVIAGVDENAEYFNGVFVDQLQLGLKGIVRSVARVLVVFNKADLLPREWTEDEAREKLKLANRHPIGFIKRCFGENIEFHVISVRTNLGIVNLLGYLGQAAIQGEDELDRFRKRMADLGPKLARRGL